MAYKTWLHYYDNKYSGTITQTKHLTLPCWLMKIEVRMKTFKACNSLRSFEKTDIYTCLPVCIYD